MDIGGISSQFATQGPGAKAPGIQGSLGGLKVSLGDPTSLIANAAEEVGFAMGEREETRLENRKMKPSALSNERIEQVKKYTELMEKQQKSKVLDAFVADLAGSGAKEPWQGAALAQKHFEDPADAFAALAYARTTLANTFGEEFFDEAMAQLEDDHGRQIQTGLAAGAAALKYGELGAQENLKALYADVSAELASPMDAYEKILADYGESRVTEALAFLSKSLGNQMAATTCATDKVLLENLSRDLGAVQQLYGLHAQCRAFEARIQQSLGGSALSSEQIMKEVLSLGRSQFLGAFDIENLCDRFGLQEIEYKIIFYQEFGKMARELSENLFTDGDTRLSLIDATQQALDDAIAIEEEIYD